MRIKKSIPVEIDDLVPSIKYDTISEEMSFKDGVNILLHRFGLSATKARRLIKDRCPFKPAKVENQKSETLNPRSFLAFDVLFSDILHSGYDELKFIKIGRKYLRSRILRAVLAGICDAMDTSGKSGDFPPRSWLPDSDAERMYKTQSEALKIMKEDCGKEYHSINVRMSTMPTDMLKSLVANESRIRTEVRKASIKDIRSGVSVLIRIFNDFNESIRSRLVKSKIKAHDITPSFKRWSLFRKSINHLKKYTDPNVRFWTRRPTDDDWYEGRWSDRRKPISYMKKSSFRAHRLKGMPGISSKVETVEEWLNLKTDWTYEDVKIKSEKNHKNHKCKKSNRK